MTTPVLWVTLSALASLGSAGYRWRTDDGDQGATVFAFGFGLSIIGCAEVHRLSPKAPQGAYIVVALGGVPAAFAPLLPGALLFPRRPPPPPEPVGTCRRCGAQLWDLRGNHRYTDHAFAFLCPPEHWQPGQHRLHQLNPTTAPAADDTANPPTPDSTNDPA